MQKVMLVAIDTEKDRNDGGLKYAELSKKGYAYFNNENSKDEDEYYKKWKNISPVDFSALIFKPFMEER